MRKCLYCGSSTALSKDHVVPFSVLTSRRRNRGGGNHSVGEVVDACMECNTHLSNFLLPRVSLRCLYLTTYYSQKAYENALAGNREESDLYVEKLRQCQLSFVDSRFEEDEEARRAEENLSHGSGEEKEEDLEVLDDASGILDRDELSELILNKTEIEHDEVSNITIETIRDKIKNWGQCPAVKLNPFYGIRNIEREILQAIQKGHSMVKFTGRLRKIGVQYYEPEEMDEVVILACLLPKAQLNGRVKIHLIETYIANR